MEHQKLHEIFQNMKRENNTDLRRRVVTGELKIDQLIAADAKVGCLPEQRMNIFVGKQQIWELHIGRCIMKVCRSQTQCCNTAFFYYPPFFF